MKHDGFTSKVLLEAAENGIDHAEQALIERYRDRLLKLAAVQLPPELQVRVDAEDVVQSACRVFIQKLRNREILVDEPGDLWSQFVSVTLNKIRSITRKHRCAKRSVFSEKPLDDRGLVDREPDPAEVGMLVETVEQILRQLPKEKQRETVVLRLQGLKTSEIAAKVNYSEERVRQIIKWVRRMLGDPTAKEECENSADHAKRAANRPSSTKETDGTAGSL